MPFSTNDPRVDFIVENYDKIKSLNECLDISKQKVPGSLKQFVFKLLEQMDFVDVEVDGDSIDFWIDHNKGYYDTESGTGLLFSIELFDWENIEATNKEDGMWLSCYVYKKSRDDLFKKWWGRNITMLKTHHTRKDYCLSPNDDCDEYIAAKYLFDVIGIDALSKSEPEELANNLKKTIREFVDYFTGNKPKIMPFYLKKNSKAK
jgi:hypothetical protein